MNDKRGFQTRFCTVAFAAPERKDCITIAVQRAMFPWQENCLLQPVWWVLVSQGAERYRAGLHEEDALERQDCGAVSHGKERCQNFSCSSSFPLSTWVWFCWRAVGRTKSETDFRDGSGSHSFSAMPWLCCRSRQDHLYFLPCLYGHHKLVLMGLVFRKLKGLVMPFQITWCNPKYVKKNEDHYPSRISTFSRGVKKAMIISDQQFHLWETQ